MGDITTRCQKRRRRYNVANRWRKGGYLVGYNCDGRAHEGDITMWQRQQKGGYSAGYNCITGRVHEMGRGRYNISSPDSSQQLGCDVMTPMNATL